MKNKKILTALFAIACMSMALVGCGNDEEAATSEPADTSVTAGTSEADSAPAETEAEVSLADWNGSWNNMGAYLDEADVQPAYEKLAEKDGITADEAKAAYVEKRKCDFNGMIVDGNKVTFLDNFEDKGGAEIAAAEYEFDQVHKVQSGSHEMEWFAFKATSPDAKYPVLLMMPVHGDEALTHFHMRYGVDADELLAKEGWFPTFVKPDATLEQISGEIAE